jgi:hypothetical protein
MPPCSLSRFAGLPRQRRTRREFAFTVLSMRPALGLLRHRAGRRVSEEKKDAVPAVFAGALLSNLSGGEPVSVWLCVAFGNTLEAVAGVALVDRFAHGTRSAKRA